MAICKYCGAEFDVSTARRSIGRSCGAGLYDEYYPDGDVCQFCAVTEIGGDIAAGDELIELMGTGWDDD